MTEATENLEPEDEKVMTWVGHLTEARNRLLKVFVFFIAAFLCVYPFSGEVLKYLMLPLAQAMKTAGGAERAIFTGVAEGFIVHLKVSAFSAAVVSFPFMAFQAWRFIAPALYPSEQGFVKPLFFVSPLLFAAGACFVFYLIAPPAFKFLLSFQQLEKDALPVVLEARIAEYLSFMMTL
ncbi:MAG TPA: twin-arginine translocase subunit TatC, partial [Alphaproteobacteria bacterium]|nr:twin-arginine translocase subunit TatC [Alphaproteobacteria bacterium]